jgi:acyl-CoA synthetase (NDP forming)
MNRHRTWAERPAAEPETFQVDRATVDRILGEVLESNRRQLTETEALEVFGAYGIATIPFRVAKSEDEAVESAEDLGFPVVLKVVSADVVHKTDAGGVKVDLRTAQEVGEAYREVLRSVKDYQPDARIDGVLVESFVKGGREVIVGVSTDPKFGPVLMFGLGGIYVEALKDVSFRVHPVTKVDADEMIRSIRGFPLLEGLRGEKGSDLEALAEVIQRISQLVGDHDGILELDLKPFLALDSGGMAVDGGITLKEQNSVSPTPKRRYVG